MRFLGDIRWELLHRVPATVLVVAAVWYWAEGKKARSIACALVGAVVGPLMVRFTATLTGGAREALKVVVADALSMSLLHVLLAAYLGAEADWSNWKVDLGLGGLAGVSLAVAEGLAACGTGLASRLWPSVPLGAGGALALVGIRELKGRTLLLALAFAALLAAVMTVVLRTVKLGC